MSVNATVKELLDYPFSKLSRRTQQRLKVYEICEDDFLEFAKEDSKGQNTRARVNALGNVKRAIECRIDSLLYYYCLHEKSKKENWDFPRKLEIIRELGIVAPSILRRVNRKRNELEHEYVIPKESEVKDAVDVAELFLAATKQLAVVSYDARNDFKLELNREEGLVRLIDHKTNVEKIAKINGDDGWIEFARRLSESLKPSTLVFHKT